ncbi:MULTISPECIES: maltose ABC transporter permease [unclassified Haloferax]|uniref:maltose ABC transporter permease n=1 Tax=unclassified Haloferax TaxID=2625095 RepID=UPI0002AFE8CD|nr:MULTISPECIES: maltose ABC transporter permease [unclassified Haloferax]ELZ58424.1 maltose:maltodextrin transport system permease [Haloferax sp. ATCC BAA-646]ELZ63144.1 maltose:maltodextrin transport system permease [Haloferax sp. ATCC BAA-644]ELZ63228.1 maltose:maltodextrin transport system permease [Haloferax sp. ATCC BAA-645]
MTPPSTDDPTRERGPDEAFCRDCGAVIDARAEICPECGVRQRDPPKSSVDSALDDLFEGGNPFVAAVLSAVFPGLGQLYNRELERGLVFAVGFIVATASVMVLIGFLLAPAVWLYAVYDAYTRAELRAEELQRESGRDRETEISVSEAAGDGGIDDEETDDGREE